MPLISRIPPRHACLRSPSSQPLGTSALALATISLVAAIRDTLLWVRLHVAAHDNQAGSWNPGHLALSGNERLFLPAACTPLSRSRSSASELHGPFSQQVTLQRALYIAQPHAWSLHSLRSEIRDHASEVESKIQLSGDRSWLMLSQNILWRSRPVEFTCCIAAVMVNSPFKPRVSALKIWQGCLNQRYVLTNPSIYLNSASGCMPSGISSALVYALSSIIFPHASTIAGKTVLPA